MVDKASRIAYNSGVIMILFLGLLYALPSLLFFIQIEINKMYFPICLLGAVVIWMFLNKVDGGEQLLSILFFLCFTFLTIIVSGTIYDITFDGNTYHKTAVGFLEHGWNPVYQRVDEFYAASGLDIKGCSTYNIWIDHYGNASWVMGSVIASFFGNIEVGKACNLLASFSMFGILQYYLSKRYLKWGWAVIISIITVINPITICQFTNYYLDGALMMYLFLGILALFALSDKKSPISRHTATLLLSVAITLCGNIKFTGLAYIAVFCIGYECLWLFWAWKEKCFQKVLVKSMAFYVGIVIFAFGVLGYPSFIQNIQETGEPLYPVIGEHSVELVSTHEAVEFEGKSNIQKLLMTTFCNVSNTMGGHIENLSWDGMIKTIRYGILDPDTRYGGYGPLFFVILILSVMIVIPGMIKLRKADKCLWSQVLLVLVITCLLLMFVSGSWYARYSPHEYLVVVFAAIFVCTYLQKSRGMIWMARSAFFICMGINMLAFLHLPYFNVRISRDIKEAYQKVEELQDTGVVGDLYFKEYLYTGVLFNFIDYNLSYADVRLGQPEMAENGIDLYGEIFNKVYYLQEE